MTAPLPPPRWTADLTGAAERLAQRLASAGATHPVAAAVGLTARGHEGLDAAAFAARYGIAADTVAAIEAGDMAWEDLPDCIGDVLATIPRIELLALADLDSHYRSLAAPPDAATS